MTPPFRRCRNWMKVRAATGLALLALAVSFSALADTVRAEEQWQPFLESLRSSGDHDMAMLYLDRMAARPDCPSDLREVLDYERGITLLSQPVDSRSGQAEKLSRANELLERFQKDHAGHAYASKAQTQLANVLIERGRLLVNDSKQPGVSAKARKKLIAQARRFYSSARTVFEQQDTHLTAELKALPEPKRAPEIASRDALRADFLQTRLSLATADYEIGMTYPPSSRRKSLLSSAARQYKGLYDKYGSFLAGLYARMWEGRCYQKLKQYSKAAEVFESVTAQADNSQAFRTLKNKSTVLLLETLINPKVKRYADALGFYSDWEKERPLSDASTPEGIEIRYLAALASLEGARSLKPDHKIRPKLLSDARSSLRFVMRFPGDIRTRARKTMADPLLETGDRGKQEPRDFDEAVELGREALDKIEIAKIYRQIGKKRLSPKKLERLTEEAEQEALDYFEQAIQLVKPDTPVGKVNQVRYYLAYLFFKQGDLYRSAVFSDYLAQRFASSTVGRPAAKIALAAFNGMISEPGISPEERSFAQRRTEQAAAYLTEVWPSSDEANDARKVLIHSALRQKNIEQAVAMVENIPTDAAGCGPLQLLVGRALYAEYVRQVTEQSEASKDATPGEGPDKNSLPKIDPVEIERLFDQAKLLLTSGLEQSVKEGKVDRSFFAGELTLARIYLNASDDVGALGLVERPQVGLLAIANTADPTVVKGGLDVEAYKTSLRVLVAVRKLNEASQVMELLEKRVAATNAKSGGTQLMQIYVSLAQELQQTLEMLQKSGKTAEAAQVRVSFEQFLDRVSSSTESTSFNVMQWIAATYCGLADSFAEKGSTALAPEAKRYYEKAVTVYEQILKRYDEDEKFGPSVEAINLIEIRMAVCLRKLGQYEKAGSRLFDILKNRNTMVDAQMEAAYTYQAWAATSGNAKRYLNAMLGGAPETKNGKKVNVIWGWGKLSKRLAGNRKHHALFHEARYNLALCRYKYAISDACKESKKNLEAAQRDINVISKLYPEMGGAEMKAKYKALYQQITQKLKK